jgi:hypothetical protein
MAGMPFSVNDVFNWSWALFKRKMWACVGIVWAAQGTSLGVQFGVNLLVPTLAAIARDRALTLVATIVGQILIVLVGFWMSIGQVKAFLRVARDEPDPFSELYKGGRYLWRFFLSSLVFGLVLGVPIAIAVGVITMVMLAFGTQSALGVIAFVVLSSSAAVLVVYVSSRLMLYYFFVVDRNAGVIESLQLSWDLCRGRVGALVLIIFLQMAIVLAGLLALCAIPLATLLLPVTYLALTGTGSRVPEKPEFIWDSFEGTREGVREEED